MTEEPGIKTEPAVDTASTVEVLASAIAKKGYRAIGRYYSFSKWKQLQPTEAQQLIAAGLSIITVYEDSNDRASSFTNATGNQQATQALHLAQNVIRQPKGSGIYFAVDYDATYYDYVNYIAPYFEAVQAVFKDAGDPYKIGVYGNGLVCEKALEDDLVKLTCLANPRGSKTIKPFATAESGTSCKGTPFRSPVPALTVTRST